MSKIKIKPSLKRKNSEWEIIPDDIPMAQNGRITLDEFRPKFANSNEGIQQNIINQDNIKNSDIYQRQLILKAFQEAEEANREKYKPSESVLKSKAIISAGQLTQPSNLYLRAIGTGADLATAINYALDGQYDKSKEDVIQAGLNWIPFLKGKPGLKQGTYNLSQFDKYFNLGNNILQKGNDTKTITEAFKSGGKIKTDPKGYWDKSNHGKPVRIPSNKITMKGVNQPLYGIDDTGFAQMMYPGQDYQFPGSSVVELPLAQDGGELFKLHQSKENEKYKIYPEKQWVENWIRDPEFEKRLTKNLEDINSKKSFGVKEIPYSFPFTYGEKYWKEKAKLQKENALKRLTTVKDFYAEGYNNNEKLIDNFYNAVYPNDPKTAAYQSLSTQVLEGGSYLPAKHALIINSQLGDKSTAVHEYTHSTNLDDVLRPMIPQGKFVDDEYNKLRKQYPGFDVGYDIFGQPIMSNYDTKGVFEKTKYINSDSLSKKMNIDPSTIQYLNKSREVYPRIMELRYENQIKPGQVIDKEFFKKIKEKSKENFIFKIYSDEQIIDLMNKLAQEKEELPLNKAKNGGFIPKMQQGGNVRPPIKGTKEQYQAYQDSLDLYNKGEELKSILNPLTKNIVNEYNKNKHFWESEAKFSFNKQPYNPNETNTRRLYGFSSDIENRDDYQKSTIKNYNNFVSTTVYDFFNTKPDINPIFTNIYSTNVNPLDAKGGHFNAIIPEYKKPVQPIIYKPENKIIDKQGYSPDKKYLQQHPVIYVDNPNDPSIGMYTEEGNLISYNPKNRPKEQPINIESAKPDLLPLPDINMFNPIPFEKGTYFSRKRQSQEQSAKGKKDYFDKKTGKLLGTYKNGGKVKNSDWEIIN